MKIFVDGKYYDKEKLKIIKIKDRLCDDIHWDKAYKMAKFLALQSPTQKMKYEILQIWKYSSVMKKYQLEDLTSGMMIDASEIVICKDAPIHYLPQ